MAKILYEAIFVLVHWSKIHLNELSLKLNGDFNYFWKKMWGNQSVDREGRDHN